MTVAKPVYQHSTGSLLLLFGKVPKATRSVRPDPHAFRERACTVRPVLTVLSCASLCDSGTTLKHKGEERQTTSTLESLNISRHTSAEPNHARIVSCTHRQQTTHLSTLPTAGVCEECGDRSWGHFRPWFLFSRHFTIHRPQLRVFYFFPALLSYLLRNTGRGSSQFAVNYYWYKGRGSSRVATLYYFT